MNEFAERLTCVLFPNRCCVCGKVIEPLVHICNRCRTDAPYVYPPVCDRCGRGEDVCTCRGARRHYERCVMPFYYRREVEENVLVMKKHAYVYSVHGFAIEMAEVLRREYGGIAFDGIVPVPMHKKDEIKRGENPVRELAKELSAFTGIPYLPALTKIVRTKPQKEMSALMRQGNLLGVFDVEDPTTVKDKTLLLVDDVMTTGSTLDECAKMLKIAGAESVYAATVAAAVLQKEENRV